MLATIHARKATLLNHIVYAHLPTGLCWTSRSHSPDDDTPLSILLQLPVCADMRKWASSAQKEDSRYRSMQA